MVIGAVLVGAADEKHLLAVVPQVSCIDVGRNVHACQMTDVYRAVRVRERRSYRVSLYVFHILLAFIPK